MTIERFHGKQLHVYLPSLNVMRILTIVSFDVLLFIDKAFFIVITKNTSNYFSSRAGSKCFGF